MKRSDFITLAIASAFGSACRRNDSTKTKPIEIYNVSYDPTREFYEDFNRLFIQEWQSRGNPELVVHQSHGGSGKQARAVIDGQPADLVTLALSLDIDEIARKTGRIAADWQEQLPHRSSPYTSTIIFVVRKGNPKGIRNWDDLVREGVQVITPDPKTGGAPRWAYLAAWAWAEDQLGGFNAARRYISDLYHHVPVLDSGARGSTTTFARNGIGDVLLSWENEAHLIAKEFPGQTEIIYPSSSILAEPPVAALLPDPKRPDASRAANEYLRFLYTPAAQDLVAKHFYRPRLQTALSSQKELFPDLPLVTIDRFGGWENAQKTHFIDGAIFDQIYGKSL